MRKIGFITDIKYIDGFNPLIEKISITIFDEETNKVVTISPTNFKKTYPFQIFDGVEYIEKDNSIKPHIPKINGNIDLTSKELEFQMKSIIAIMDDPLLGELFKNHLTNALDLLLPSTKPKSH